MFTKGGTQIESGSIPGLPPGVTPSNLLEAIKKQMAKEGKAEKMGGAFEELGRHMGAEEDDDSECACFSHGESTTSGRGFLCLLGVAGPQKLTAS